MSIPFTFSIWRRAFTPHHAFGDALRALGYRGFSSYEWKSGDSLLEKVFGRAYVNLDLLSQIYYGKIPYKIVPRPRPHTQFDFKKLNLKCILNFPQAVASMIRVGWNLSARRRHYFQRCLQELALVILTEATTQSLRQLLKDPIGEMNVDSTMRRWLAKGLHTVTFEMQRDYAHACAAVEARPGFLTRYGHRGPGEMDLASPRWSEMGDLSFQKSSTEKIWENHSAEVETEILNINSYKKEMILEEWKFLKALLETREAWKMELLKPYAWIRLLVVELGRRSDLGNLIHWLSLEEILSGQDMSNRGESRKILDLISERKAEATEFRKFSLPDYLDLQILENILNQSPVAPARQADGEPLSPGLAFGEVRFVHDPAQVNPEDWPKDVILLAESTDPGWTPLFTRVRGVVVERGGVLSHCAILSREMGLPAVSGIQGLAQKFKDGDHVWVDGNHGRVTRDEN